jgi:hypothetical protein
MLAHRRHPSLARIAAIVLLLGVAMLVRPDAALVAPIAPTGVTAIALDGKVEIAWQQTQTGATYDVLRDGTVIQAGVSGTSYTDNAAGNGTQRSYTVRESAPASPASRAALATPRAASCASGNAIARENCFPGTTGWKATNVDKAPTGIEGFATKTSVNQGGSLDLKVDTADGAAYRVEIYRTGYYGGNQGRLISVLPALTGVNQDPCASAQDDTGLVDCANWSTSATITTTQNWPTGVYLAKLVRENGGADSHILFVVRNDGDDADVLYRLPDTTYQAYNPYGGRSVYDWNSSGDTTVAGTSRAVKVSFNRPYRQVYTTQRDFYTYSDIQNVSWLEQQGYDVDYISTVDLESQSLTGHKVAISASHDEYWSSAVRSKSFAARDAGTSLVFLGGNGAYWHVRFENSNRTMAVYKTTQSGAEDPVSSTRTWRDPLGTDQPENALMGQMYIGDNDSVFFPLKVSAAEGRDRFWRHTGLENQPDGAVASVGSYLVGWEWDAQVNNGRAPAGVQVLASSPVNGSLLTDAGRVYTTGSATATSVRYRAASGAIVWATGTNHWSRGLGRNIAGVGEPSAIISQATANMLTDMGALATTPASGIAVDGPGAPAVTGRTPAPGATGVSSSANVTATFDRSLDPSTVTPQTFTLTDPDGATVTATTSWDDASRTATLRPSQSLDSATTYTARLTTGLKTWAGSALASTVSWTFTTAGGIPPAVSTRSPGVDATGVSTAATVSATFDRRLDPASVNGQTVTLRDPGGQSVPGQVAYDSATRRVNFNPAQRLAASTRFTATLSTGILAGDGTAMANPVSWSFTTQAPLTVTTRTPAPLASGISPGTDVRARFSRAVDPASVSDQTFRLTAPGGSTVNASVSYDAASRTARLVPASPLALLSTYTATLTSGVRAADDAEALGAVSWTFSTPATAPPPPAPTALTPAAGAVDVSLDSVVRATFNRELDPDTVSGQSFILRDNAGTPLAGTVSYDAAAQSATFQPSAALSPGEVYRATLTTAVRSAVGTALPADLTWTFTAADCPCSLLLGRTPELTGLPVRDGRPFPGPWTYELGTKFTVDQDMRLTALKFYKDAGETGTHVGRLWTASGTPLAQATFSGETASGWQRQALATPVTLTAGQTYVASVGLNERYVLSQYGLQSELRTGPLRSVADGANGVYAGAAGSFPTSSYRSSNYFVDVVVRRANTVAPAPHVASVSPVQGDTDTPSDGDVRASFDIPLDPGSVDATSVSLRTSGGTVVPATVSYDGSTRTAILRPTSVLGRAATYTARLSTGIRSEEGTPLASQFQWTFTTAAAPAPRVTSTSPVDGAGGIGSAVTVRATLTPALDPATVNATNFTLTGPSGAVAASVSYDAATGAATLVPSAALDAGATYTARVGTGVRSTEGAALPAAVSWSFTVAACPCSLYAPSATPAITGLDTRDGRSGTGPFTYELGTKIQVATGSRLTALRFYKDAGETGTHVGRVWTSSGTPLGQVTFTGESASGWQEQALASAITLAPGQVYVVSVGMNSRFVATLDGLRTARTSGPLSSVADDANGVFASAAGVFPTSSYRASSYFVDAVVR